MSFHACDGTLRNIDDVAASDPRIKDLYFHHLLRERIYIARRGLPEHPDDLRLRTEGEE